MTAQEGRVVVGYRSSAMNERQSSEVERVLLHVAGARTRARCGAGTVAKDGVFVDQIEQTCIENEALATQARVNSPENFKLALDRSLKASSSTASTPTRTSSAA